jgi:murein DD-endopeptidase MepM/ murein hydrolase activator NlpD
MKPRHHTILFIPSERSQTRKWRVTNLQIGVALGALAALTLAAALSIWGFMASKVDRAELARLQSENEKLRQSNQNFETRLQGVQSQISEYEDRTRKLAIVAGLENLGASGEGGVGGEVRPGALPSTDLVMTDLESRSSDLAGSLGRVAQRLDQNLQLISATPAIAPVRGILTSGFGNRRDPITGQRAFHSGIDISAPPGKPVKVTADGIVVRTEEYGGLGRAVYVAHGFGIVTIYGHMSRIQVTPGQRLKRGQTVGLVGNTGRATGYHLHYEVQLDGKLVDPLSYILDGAVAGS